MQIILQEDIHNLGQAGEVVNVSKGYGRNFLIPQKKGLLANLKNLKMLEHQKRVVKTKQDKLKNELTRLAEKLSKVSLTIFREAAEIIEEKTVKTAEATPAESPPALETEKEMTPQEQIPKEGLPPKTDSVEAPAQKIFGSVGTKDIAEALRQEGFVVDRHKIFLKEPLKQLGVFEIPIHLHSQVTATIKVQVAKKSS